VLEVADLPPELGGSQNTASPCSPADAGKPAVAGVNQGARIRRALLQARGHPGEAAALLGISRVTLWRRMKQLGLGRVPDRRRQEGS